MGEGEHVPDRTTELVAGQEALKGERRTLAARLDAFIEETKAKVKRLFEFHDANERRVGKIERDYVPRDALQRLEDKLDDRLVDIVKSQRETGAQVTRIMAVGVVVVVLINTVISVLPYLLGK